jgi:Acyl-CoA dehydrogenase, C-terminal domain
MTMDGDELALVRASLRNVLHTSDAANLTTALVSSGWVEVLIADPAVAIGALAEEQGSALLAGAVVDLAMLHGADLDIDPTVAVVLPLLQSGEPMSAHAVADGWAVDGLVLAGHARADRFLVTSLTGLLMVPAVGLTFSPVAGGDVGLGLHRANGVLPTSDVEIVGDEAAREAAIAGGRRALGSELVGGAAQMLANTVAYVMQRHQYGRAIGSFQAVKHQLADVHVAITAARSGVAASWQHRDPVTAMAAKCLAGRAHQLASTHCHQVHGGIAFTTEHGFHRWIRRGQLLDSLLGTSAHLTDEIGRHLISSAAVPWVPALRNER